MKYIALSFDDGFASFKEIVLPILNKYSFKVSINVVTGFSDGTFKHNFSRLSVKDIKELDAQGHEIVVHTNSHLKPTNIDDFEIARIKLIGWLGPKKSGAIIPYSQSINNDVYDYLKNNFLYVADYSKCDVKRSIKEQLFRIRNMIHRTAFGNNVVSNHYYLYNKNSINHTFPSFVRLPVKQNVKPKEILKTIKLAKDETCLTIVFHSIVDGSEATVEWPDGSWTKENFDTLLFGLSQCKNVKVLTQKELLNDITNK